MFRQEWSKQRRAIKNLALVEQKANLTGDHTV